jgi:hypothetical protein
MYANQVICAAKVPTMEWVRGASAVLSTVRVPVPNSGSVSRDSIHTALR